MSLIRIAGANFKTPNLVHLPARQNARGQDCQLRLPVCNFDPQTSALCHLRMFGIAGMAQKPDDWCAVIACSACHDALDGRSDIGLWGYEDVLRGLIHTLKIQFAAGVFVPGKGD